MPTDAILELATSPKSVVKALEENPNQAISDVAHKVFPQKDETAKSTKNGRQHVDYTPEDLDRAEKCGQFPYRPSNLFLKMYCDVLDTLEHGPLKNMVSPPLMGSSGVIAFSVVSLIPDIMRYYKTLIVNAQHEVMIATNYWEPSWAGKFVFDGIIELSKRHEGKPTKPVVKLIFDRGSPKQIIKNHQTVPPEQWEDLGIPTKDQAPNIHLEVMNYHKPAMGTFHSKYMVVDRRVALLNSNNIQDRVNLEFCMHLEGPIVEAFYDMSMLSWAEKMDPPMPLIVNPSEAVKGGQHDCFEAAKVWKADLEATSAEALPKPEDKIATDYSLLNCEDFQPFLVHQPHDPVPIAMVNRAPHGTPGHGDVDVPQNAAWLAAIRLAQKSIFIQTPDFNAEPVVPAILDACRRGVECTLYVDLGYNDQGEMLPMQGGTNSKVMNTMCETLKKEGKRQFLKASWYTGKDRKKPIDAAAKERACHIKFLCVDGQVAIAGNGNQDTQSWYHSQEINVMVDSPQICSEWVNRINHNQNSGTIGVVGDDGFWRDEHGEVVTSSGGTGGPKEVLKGMLNAVKRVQGKGGF